MKKRTIVRLSVNHSPASYKIKTKEEYEYCLTRGFDPLYDTRFPMEHNLRLEIQREKFGVGNHQENNQKFYAYNIKNKRLVCENCGKPILNPCATNVSHILSRGSHPEMAYDPRNANILCAECHARWEHPLKRGLMPIYPHNESIISLLKKEYYGTTRVSKSCYANLHENE